MSIAALAGVLAWTLCRLLLANQTELIPEEAYYWTYSQHPALGYFDHPPMVAWMIWLGTALLGDTELGVRIVAIALWPASAWWLYLTGKLWFGRDVGALAVVLFCLSPIFVGVGFIVTPDAPLVFFWSLTLYALSQALHSGQSRFWLLAGFGFGCALLSKYTAVVLAGSLFVFLVLSSRHRHWLARPQPWLALALGIAVFSPVIIWNAQHQWASFIFQSTRTVGQQHDTLEEVGMFWLYQVLALGPFLLAGYAYALVPALRRGWLQREDSWSFAVSFALPLFGIFVLASFKNKGHVNWTAPAYLAWSLAAAAIFLEGGRLWQIRLWRWLLGAGVALSVAVGLVGHASLAWGVPKAFAFSNAGGWRDLAQTLGQARDGLSQSTGQPAFIIGGDKLNIAAETGFYWRQPAQIVNEYALGVGNGIGYRYWVDLKSLAGRPAIVALPGLGPYSLALLQMNFAQVEAPMPVEVGGPGKPSRKVYLVRCHGYLAKH